VEVENTTNIPQGPCQLSVKASTDAVITATCRSARDDAAKKGLGPEAGNRDAMAQAPLHSGHMAGQIGQSGQL